MRGGRVCGPTGAGGRGGAAAALDGDGLGMLVLDVVLLGVDALVLLEVLGPLERLLADLVIGGRVRVKTTWRRPRVGQLTGHVWGLSGVWTGRDSGQPVASRW